jgi:hypothetical protein
LVIAVVAAPLTATAGGAAELPRLGQPDHIGYLVSDLNAAKSQLAAATGTEFGPVSTTKVKIAGGRRVSVTRTVSKRGAPFIELDHAASGGGPWTARPDRAQMFLSYSVGEISGWRDKMKNANMKLVASGRDFSLWRGLGGMLIRLVDSASVPSGAGTNQSRADIDLGAPAAMMLYPCAPDAVRTQLQGVLGVTWRDPQTYTLPWTLPDGSTRMVTGTSTLTQDGTPFLGIETPHGLPGEDVCTSDHTPAYLVFTASDVVAADAQFDGAGLRPVGRVPALISAYRGAGGLPVEAASPSFMPTS